MKFMSTLGVLPLTALAMLGLATVFAGSYAFAGTYDDDAEAAERIMLADRGNRNARRQGHRADRGQRSRAQSRRSETTRTDQGYRRDTTWTGENGRTVNRQEDVRYDRENQSRTRDVTWTGPEGNTRGRSDTVTRTDDGFDRSTEFTRPNGDTATRDAEVRYDRENRTRTRDVTWTGPEGNTAGRSDTLTRTDDGYTRDTQVTGPQGGTGSRAVTGRWDPETGTWTREVEIEREPAN